MDQPRNDRHEDESNMKQSGSKFLIHKKDIDAGWAWAVLVGGAVSNVIYAGFTSSAGVWYIKVMDVYGSGPSQTALIYSVNSVTASLAAFLSGYLSDHYAMSLPMLVASCVGALATVSVGFVSTLWPIFLTLGAINGVCRGILTSPVYSSLCRYFERKRVLASCLVASAGSLGALSVPPLTQMITQEYSLVGAMVFIAGLMLQYCITAVILLPMVPKPDGAVEQRTLSTNYKCDIEYSDRPEASHASVSTEDYSKNTGNICSVNSGSAFVWCCLHISKELSFLRNGNLIRVWLCVTLCCMAYLSFFVFLPAYGLELGLDTAQISLIFIIVGATEFTSRLILGYVMTKYSLDETLVLLTGCVTATLVCIGLRFLPIFWCMCLLSALLATTGSIFLALMIPLVARVVNEADLGRALGGLPLAMGVGPAVGSPLFGALAEASGSYGTVQIGLSVCYVVSAGLLLWNYALQRKQRKRPLNIS